MQYAIEMGSDAMICTPGFIMIGSDIQNLMEWIHRHEERRCHKPTFLFFLTKESRLKHRGLENLTKQ
jgi:hypothetical protein